MAPTSHFTTPRLRSPESLPPGSPRANSTEYFTRTRRKSCFQSVVPKEESVRQKELRTRSSISHRILRQSRRRLPPDSRFVACARARQISRSEFQRLFPRRESGTFLS